MANYQSGHFSPTGSGHPPPPGSGNIPRPGWGKAPPPGPGHPPPPGSAFPPPPGTGRHPPPGSGFAPPPVPGQLPQPGSGEAPPPWSGPGKILGPGGHGTLMPPSHGGSVTTTRPFANGDDSTMVSGMPPPPGQFRSLHGQFQQPPGQFQPPPTLSDGGGGAHPGSAGHTKIGAPPPNQFAMDQVGAKLSAHHGAYGAFPIGATGTPAPQMSQPNHLPQPIARASNPPTAQVSGPAVTSTSTTFLEEHVDWNIQHPKEMLQFTANRIPQSAQLSQNSKVVLGGVIRPFVTLPEGIPTVMPGPAGIVRCKKCRTYMNAFVSWMENGRRWRCNICGQANDCPSAYFCHLDPQTNVRRDKNERAELSHSVVEYIAPNEYMVRPPQPSAYFFVLDVSAQAVGSGMLSHVAAAIKKVLLEEKKLPGGERAQIGFLAYDTSVQYFNLSKRGRKEEGSGVSQPQMLTVSDLVELFVPLPPDDLLVNLSEHLDTVETFLEALPTMFTPSADEQKHSSVLQNESALGPALKAAFTILKPLGGKMLVFNSLLPSVQKVDGCLNPREVNPRIMGTEAENALLRPQSNWYKDTAVEFSRAQISVDLFVTNFSYADVATLTDLPKYTAGNFYSFANFSPRVDGERLEKSVYHTLTRPTALEAVMRVRCTRGLRVTNFYGNFYIRGQDLLALPNCSADASYGFTIQHEDNVVPSNVLTVQSALLYTSTDGERRIRVITTVLPVVSDMKSVTNSVNVNALSALLSKQGVDYALKNGPGAARTKLVQGCIDVIKTARTKPQQARLPGAPPGAYNQQGGGEEEEVIPPHLELLPLMVLGMVKNIALRGGTDVHPDERCAAMQIMSTIWPGSRFKSFLYPKLFRIDQMGADAGLPCDDAHEGDECQTGAHMPNELVAGLPGHKVRLPPMLNLTVNVLSSEGVYCLENGVDAFVWVGRQAGPTLLLDLFGVESLEQADPSQLVVGFDGSDVGRRLYAILSALQAEGAGAPRAYVIREALDEYLERKFLWHLLEDSAQFENGTFSYEDFMQFVEQRSSATNTSSRNVYGGASGPGNPLPPGGPPPHGARMRVNPGGTVAPMAPGGMAGMAPPMPPGSSGGMVPPMHNGPPGGMALSTPQGGPGGMGLPMTPGPPGVIVPPLPPGSFGGIAPPVARGPSSAMTSNCGAPLPAHARAPPPGQIDAPNSSMPSGSGYSMPPPNTSRAPRGGGHSHGPPPPHHTGRGMPPPPPPPMR